MSNYNDQIDKFTTLEAFRKEAYCEQREKATTVDVPTKKLRAQRKQLGWDTKDDTAEAPDTKEYSEHELEARRKYQFLEWVDNNMDLI